MYIIHTEDQYMFWPYLMCVGSIRKCNKVLQPDHYILIGLFSWYKMRQG